MLNIFLLIYTNPFQPNQFLLVYLLRKHVVLGSQEIPLLYCHEQFELYMQFQVFEHFNYM